MLLLWRLVANLKNIGELGCSLWLGALHAFTGLYQEFSLVNFVTRLESLIGDWHPDAISLLDGVSYSLTVVT